MGVVYEAFDRERGLTVALKTLRKGHPSAIARFKREFRSLADVVHPNLVGLYELVADHDNLFFTMELVLGAHFNRWVRKLHDTLPTGSLTDEDSSETLATRSPLVSARVDQITNPTGESSSPASREQAGELDITRLRLGMRQLAEGVAAIHDAGLLHRDLKPSNVLVTEEGRIVLLDFGLVADIAEESMLVAEDRPLEGTPAYMSPEQGARGALTPASDWYSVGVILYHSLTGRLPFVGGRDDVLMDKQRFEPPPPRQLEPDVPGDLDALCVELLRREPRPRPTGADVLRRLGSEMKTTMITTSAGSSQSGYEIMVGREREISELRDAFATARSGRAVIAKVFGPSGMGKSRIVRNFLDAIHDEDPEVIVLRGRCYERESVPFKAIDSLIDDLSKHLAAMPALDAEGLMPRDALSLARVFPVLRQVEAVTSRRRRAQVSPDPQELRQRAFEALRELLVRLADRNPLVLAIDDLQWGDVDSAALLAAVLRPPDPPALLLLASYRSEDIETSSFLTAFESQTSTLGIDVRGLEVGPLSPDHARELALLHLGERGDLMAQAEQIAHESRGSPLFVEELARHLRDQTTEEGAPVSLGEVMRNRLMRLPTPAGRLLSMIAVAGRPMPQTVAMRAAGVVDPAMLSLLKAGSFVRTRAAGGDRFVEPYHDRIRENAVSLLDAEELRAHHLRLAEVFEASPHPDPETLATHYFGANELARAAEFGIAAARRAADSLAFDRAARLYRFALQIQGANRDRKLCIALGDALAYAGRGAEAADAYFEAVPGAPRAEALDLQCRASSQLLFSGHIDRGVDALEQVSAEVGMRMARTPARALASIVWQRFRIAIRGLKFKEKDEREVPATQLMKVDVAFRIMEGLGMADVIRAVDLQATGLLLALKTGEPRRCAHALMAEAVMISLAGVPAAKRAARIMARVQELSDRLDDPGLRGITIGAAGMIAFNQGRWNDAFEKCHTAEQIFRDECTGYRWELATAQIFQGFALGFTARIREMLDRFPILLKEARERGDLYAATSLRAALGLYVPLSNDDPEGAHQEIDDALAQWSPRGYHLQHANALNSRTSIDLYMGNGIVAHERIESEWKPLKRSFLLRPQLMRGLFWSTRARAALAANRQRPDRALVKLAAKGARILRREKVDYITAEALSLEAALALEAGDLDSALIKLERSEKLFASTDTRLSWLCIKRTRGKLIGGDEGAALIRSVDDFFTEQGLRRPDRAAALFTPASWYVE